MTTTRSFWLKPFTPLAGPSQMDIVGRAVRQEKTLTISFEMLGDVTPERLPDVSNGDVKLLPFWEITCLKCFVAPVSATDYWEFVLQPTYEWVECFSASPSAWDFQISPNHDWTVLRYDDYRLNPQAKKAVRPASYSLLSTPKALHTLLKIDLSQLFLVDPPLRIGLAAIAKLSGKQTTYWALAYPDSGPDFHHPESFALPI